MWICILLNAIAERKMASVINYQSTLPVRRAIAYEDRSPNYDLPFEIGCFSINAESRYCDDGHQMKYLSMPHRQTGLHMDLNEGFRDYIYESEDTDNNYRAILKWILSHEDSIREHYQLSSSSRPDIDFVLFRGILTSISSSIYERQEDWMIYATKFRSVIYLCDVWTDRKRKAEESLTEEQKRMCTWGYKFEQHMVSDSVATEPDTSVPVNENEKYFAVFKSKLGHHRLLLSAEIDGVDTGNLHGSGGDSMSPKRYIELKTHKIMRNDKQKWTFKRYKLLKWYLQTYFAGITKVICGFRDDLGVVRKLKVFDVREMPERAKDLWSPDACLNFTSDFLDYVKECVVRDDAVYKFYWKPGSDVTCEELDSESAFLPDWYTRDVRVI